MLDVKKNRHLLTDLLAPPAGYDFDRAMATTYSLDLTALLSVPLKLLRGEDATLKQDPIRLLQALQEQGQRLRVYHQYGLVLPVATAHPLLCWLEAVTVGVPPPQCGAFHPKIWVIRFLEREGKGIKFRFVAGSRNLTFDRSADVVVAFDGDTRNKVNKKAKPLVDFLSYLNGFGAIDEDGSFLRQLQHTTFRGGGGFDYFGLHFSGYNDEPVSWWNKIRAERAVVLSPFLSNEVVRQLSTVCGQVTLVSRRLALQKLDKIPTNVTAYHFKDSFIDRDQLLEYGQENPAPLSSSSAPAAAPPAPTDLHAKVFSFEQDGRSYTFLGSGNATSNATKGVNVEAMVELRSKPEVFGPTILEKDLLLGQEGSLLEPFEDVVAPEETDKEQAQKLVEEAMRHLLVRLAERRQHGRVEVRDGHYDIHVTLNIGPLPAGYRAVRLSTWSLFDEAHGVPLLQGRVTKYVARSLRPEQVSRWLAIQVQSEDEQAQLTRLIKIDLSDIPAERDTRVITSILTNERHFFDYLLLLLTDNYEMPEAVVDKEEAEEWAYFGGAGEGTTPPLYERLARQLALHPATLRHLETLMTTLASERDGVVSKRFRELWSVFTPFLTQDTDDE